MRSVVLSLALLSALAQVTALAKDRPIINSSEAANHAGSTATVYGRVIEVRRVAKGPLIFEIDGSPSTPIFRALVYPMAVPRFEFTPEQKYLGEVVEITGPITVRKKLPQIWINDPSAIRLRQDPNTAPPSSPPPPAEAK